MTNVYAFRADEPTGPEPAATFGYPDYEGKAVHSLRLRLSSVSGLPSDDGHHGIDQLVRFTIECRVTGVNHKVDERSGLLERVETLKVLEITETEWEDA